MNISIDHGFLRWPLLKSPERTQMLLLLMLVADEEGYVNLDATSVTDLSSRTYLSIAVIRKSIKEFCNEGILSGTEGEVILKMPEGVSCGATAQQTCMPAVNIKTKPVTKQASIKEVTSEDFPEGWWQLINRWLEYKRKERRGTYKNMATLSTFYNHMLKMTHGDLEIAERAIEHSISNMYMGLILDPTDKDNRLKETQYERTRNQARELYLSSESKGSVKSDERQRLLGMLPE